MHTEGQARELLAATERAKGALKRGPVVTASDHGEPTLAELGITKNESSKAQRLAALPTPRPASPLGARQAAATPPRREGGKFRTVRNFTPPQFFPTIAYAIHGKRLSRHAASASFQKWFAPCKHRHWLVFCMEK